MQKSMGMTVSILRNAELGDCSNGGISGRVAHVTLVYPGVPEIHPVSADAPAVKLVKRRLFGETYVHAEPIDRPAEGNVGWMAGGTYIHTSDSRWRLLVGHGQPIALHDRQETPDAYRVLSI